MEQLVIVPASVYNKRLISQSVTKQGLPNYQPSQNPTYQSGTLKKVINKKIFSKVDSLVDKGLSCPHIKLSNSQTLNLDDVETGIVLLDSAQQLRLKNADVPDIYFTFLEAAGISPTLILNQNAQGKERGSSVFLKIWTSGAAKAVHTGWCCLWVCTQLSENWQSVSIKGETIFAFKTLLYKIYSCYMKIQAHESICQIQ